MADLEVSRRFPAESDPTTRVPNDCRPLMVMYPGARARVLTNMARRTQGDIALKNQLEWKQFHFLCQVDASALSPRRNIDHNVGCLVRTVDTLPYLKVPNI